MPVEWSDIGPPEWRARRLILTLTPGFRHTVRLIHRPVKFWRSVGVDGRSRIINTESAQKVYYWAGARRGMPPTLRPGTFLDREAPGFRFRTVYVPDRSYHLWAAPSLAIARRPRGAAAQRPVPFVRLRPPRQPRPLP